MKSKDIIYFITIIIISSCSINKIVPLRFQSAKTTLLEEGSIERNYNIHEMELLYKSSELSFSQDSTYLILEKMNRSVDSISLLSSRNKIHDVLSNFILDTYPTDNFNKCFNSKGIDCDISKKLLDLIGIRNVKNTKIQIGKSLDEEIYYIIFYEKENIHLVSENEMLILSYK